MSFARWILGFRRDAGDRRRRTEKRTRDFAIIWDGDLAGSNEFHDHRGRRPWLPALQAPAALIFGDLAFIAVASSSQIGSTPVAVSLLADTVWDIIHLRARAILTPSLAEWCAVLDTLIAIGILILVWA